METKESFAKMINNFKMNISTVDIFMMKRRNIQKHPKTNHVYPQSAAFRSPTNRRRVSTWSAENPPNAA